MAETVVDRWTGAALIRQRIDRWTGSASVQQRLGDAPAAAMDAPAGISGLVRRWRADSIAQANATAVASWPALTGGVALAQATAGARPTYITAGIGGQPTVRFAGTDDVLGATTLPALPQPCTFVVVHKFNSVAAQSQLIDTGTLQLLILPSQYDSWAGVDLVAGTPTTSAAVYSAVFNGAASRTLLNGTQIATGDAGTQSAGAGTFDVGGRPASANRFAQIDVSEILVYSKALSTAELSTVHSYVQTRYGITVAA